MSVESRALYKCRRCGEIDRSTCGDELTMKVAVIEATVTGTCSRFGIPVSLVSSHTCKDGGNGVTDLIGCEIEPK